MVLGQSDQSSAGGSQRTTRRQGNTEHVSCQTLGFRPFFEKKACFPPVCFVGGSRTAWGRLTNSVEAIDPCWSARHAPDGVSVWPDSGFPRSTGFQPVHVHRGGFANAGYRRVRMKDSSSLRLSKPMNSYQTICSIALFGFLPVSTRISMQTFASGICSTRSTSRVRNSARCSPTGMWRSSSRRRSRPLGKTVPPTR